MINSNLTSIIKESLSPRTEFWDSSKTLKVLAEESYFRDNDDDDVQWPEVLKKMMSDSKSYHSTIKDLNIQTLGNLLQVL